MMPSVAADIPGQELKTREKESTFTKWFVETDEETGFMYSIKV